MPTIINGDRIVGQSITGVTIGGGARLQGEMGTTTAGGVTVQFEKGDNLSMRQVMIGGSMAVTLMAGSSTSMNVNGINVRSAGPDLWVNGERVSFSGEGAAKTDEKSSARLAALQKRFPGVEFAGDLAGVVIADDVTIAAGAHIELIPGLSIDGGAKIGAHAVIGGGRISGGQIDGTVSGGNLTGCMLDAGASVSGGNLNRAVLRAGARVSGGNVDRSTLEAEARISGGNVEYTTLKPGARISGGSVDNCLLNEEARISGGVVSYVQLPAGHAIAGGIHERSINPDSAKSGGVSVVINGSTIGAGDVVVGNVARGFGKIASVHVTQNFGTVSGTVVGAVFDEL